MLRRAEQSCARTRSHYSEAPQGHRLHVPSRSSPSAHLFLSHSSLACAAPGIVLHSTRGFANMHDMACPGGTTVVGGDRTAAVRCAVNTRFGKVRCGVG